VAFSPLEPAMTAASTHELPLASEFPQATREQWLSLVDQVLKDVPFDRKLVARSYDAVAIQPLHARAAKAKPLARRAAATGWDVLQRIDHRDPAAANAQALHDLANGATGLKLVIAGSPGAFGHGLPPTAEALARALRGVRLDAGIALELDVGAEAQDGAASLASLLRRQKIDPAATNIMFGFDPLGAMALGGGASSPWRERAPLFARTIADLAAEGFKGPFAAADGRVIHAAAGSEAQELAFVLATALAYLRALEASGTTLAAARRMLFFRLAADADQLLTVAKLRALRKLWARVEEACGLTPEPVLISAETAWRMLTRRDPWVNILRATVAAFAAGVGGADAVAVLPFTPALGLPDRSARRIARNMQLILLEEANLGRVIDPGAGAGGIEDVTDQLCHIAWSLFQEIEAAGGVSAALERELIQKKVAAVRAERERALALGRDPLTGTSAFPDLAEMPLPHLDLPQPPATPTKRVSGFAPLAPLRLAEPFEELRDASDRLLAQTGVRPKVFLANLGKPADFTPRATFAKNFFAAGGIEAIASDGFADAEAMVRAFRASGAKLVCLCSADRIYAHEAEAAANALAAAGASQVYLAGRPGANETASRRAGVAAFIHSGCDALATLRSAHDILTGHKPNEATGA
jgi:methylmalonyl-CoA mutase